jgi:hypothetical protein
LFVLIITHLQATTYYLTSAGAGSASTPSSWNTNSSGGGTAASNFTTDGDIFIIPSGINGTFTSSVTFGNTGNGSQVNVQINGTATINNNVTLTFTGKSSKNSSSMIVNGTLICAGITSNNLSLPIGNATNTFTLNAGATLKTANNNGITNGNNTTYSISSTTPGNVSLNTGANYEFIGSGIQGTTGLPSTTNNLTLSGTAQITTGTALTIGGNLNIGDGTTFTAAGYTLTVSGTTTVGGGTNGVLNISSATGTKIFTGLVTVNSGASWTNTSANSAVTFLGGITNNGTFNAGTGIHTFSTSAQALSGTLAIPNVTVTGIALTNNNTLTVGTALSGTGSLTQVSSATLNIGGTSGITTLTATATGNTVNYTGASQSIHPNSYYNLTLSGSGVDAIVTGTTVTNNFSIAPTGNVKANIGAGLNIPVGSLTLGSLGRKDGTWGSSTATFATYHNDTYFSTTTGYVTVSSDTRSTPTINTLPTAGTITYGQALSNSTLSGGTASVGGSFAFTTPATQPAAGTYSASITFTPTDLSTYLTTTGNVNVTVNKATLTVTASNQSKIYGSTGPTSGTLNTNFTVSGLKNSDAVSGATLGYSGSPSGNLATAAVGSYTITPSAVTFSTGSASNYSISYATGTLMVNPLPVVLSGSRIYNGTATVSYTILTITNIIGSDNITVASGSGTLASANSGTQMITSFGSLTLGGTALSNYTLTGASGTVIIGKVTPTVSSWPTASSICQGSALSSSTLSGGSASITGSFNFTTPGTIPSSSGTFSASVTFMSSDATNYSSVVGSVNVYITASGTWLGTTSTDWFDASNWCGGVPAANATIVIPSSLSNYPTISGSSPIHDVSLSSPGTLTIQDGATLTLAAGPVFTIGSGVSVTTATNAKIILKTDAVYRNFSNSTPTLTAQRQLTGVKGWRMVASPVTTAYNDMYKSPLVTQGFTGSTYPTLQPNLLWWDETDPGTTLQSWRQPSNISNSIVNGRGYFHYVFNGAGITSGGTYSDALPLTMTVTGTEPTIGSGYNYSLTYTARTQPAAGSDTIYYDLNALDQGWNLIGNPTASTLDWDASAWTKTNIDNTIYIWDPSALSGNGDYLTWNGSTGTLPNGKIAPFQAFWVHANSATASPVLSFTNDAKATVVGSFLRSPALKTEVVVPLTLSGQQMETTSFITFSYNGLVGPDDKDAYRLESMNDTKMELYTLSSPNHISPLTINNLPYADTSLVNLPLYVDGQINGANLSGSFILKWQLPDNWPAEWKINLQDNTRTKVISMNDNTEYAFDYKSTTNKSSAVKTSGLSDGLQTNMMFTPQPFVVKKIAKVQHVSANTAPFNIVISKTGKSVGYLAPKPHLLPNYPNPFSTSTTISFSLPNAAMVQLDVYNIQGMYISNIINGHFPAGFAAISWIPDKLSPGVYFIRMISKETVETQKIFIRN